jgi:hypothetical protein
LNGERISRLYSNGDVVVLRNGTTSYHLMGHPELNALLSKLVGLGFLDVTNGQTERELMPGADGSYFKRTYVVDGSTTSLQVNTGVMTNSVSVYGLEQLRTHYPENLHLRRLSEAFNLVEAAVANAAGNERKQ